MEKQFPFGLINFLEVKSDEEPCFKTVFLSLSIVATGRPWMLAKCSLQSCCNGELLTSSYTFIISNWWGHAAVRSLGVLAGFRVLHFTHLPLSWCTYTRSQQWWDLFLLKIHLQFHTARSPHTWRTRKLFNLAF